MSSVDTDQIKTDISSNAVKIQALITQFPSILTDFKKNYVLSNMSPTDQTYKNFLSTSKNQVVESTAKIFAINNDIQQQLNTLYTNTLPLDTNVKREKEQNEKLTSELNQVKRGISGSEIMIKDYKTTYTRQYVVNCTMLIGIFLVGYLMKKIYTIKT